MAGISGFPEFLPGQQIAFNRLIEKIKHVFHLYGFFPMETPAVERLSTLLSKGADHEIYGLYRVGEEASGKELGLRFDLTVPLARYVAEHAGQLLFPYARYHIAPVWRGERPQAGRYRQFYQCDIDVIGQDVLDVLYDAQIVSLIQRVLESIGVQRFTIKVNHTKILLGLLLAFGITQEAAPAMIRLIDKAEKMPLESWKTALLDQGLSPAGTELLVHLRSGQTPTTWPSHPLIEEGLAEMHDILDKAAAFGLSANCVVFTPHLARGLDYYTGLIYEVAWHDAPELGTICAGGRYGALVAGFGGKTFPGVGVSFGISRIIPKLLQDAILPQTVTSVLVTVQDRACINDYIRITHMVRTAGIGSEIYLADRPLSAQMKYASKRGFPMVLIASAEELKKEQLSVRFLETGKQHTIATEDIVAYLKEHA